MVLKNLDSILQIARSKKAAKKIVVAAAADEYVLLAIKSAYDAGIAVPVLVGDRKEIEKICAAIGFNISKIEIIDEQDLNNTSSVAVDVVRSGNAGILMKGLISTENLLKAVLEKEKGLRKSEVLSHVAFFESPYYHKVFAITDAAMNIAPGLNEKAALINNAVEVFLRLGIKNPKVAVLAAVERVNPKMEATIHAALLTEMNRHDQIKNCIVDGPLALDIAASKEAAAHKGVVSEVAGDADIFVTPDINSGNIFYKSINFLGGGFCAAVIMGASVPVILTSRSDNERSKLLSIALASAME